MTYRTVPIALTWILVTLPAIAIAHAQVNALKGDWKPYGSGFSKLAGQGKGGSQAFYCENGSASDSRGAQYTVALNQSAPKAFVVSAWSKCEGLNGSADDGYSLYIDLNYMDGGHLWGTVAPFSGGTHGWQERQVRILPTKPVKEALVYLLLRGHSGKAWFSDIAFAELGGKGNFDFQAIAAPKVSGSGWFVRDVALNSPIQPVAASTKLGLRVVISGKEGSSKIQVFDERGTDRALTLYYCEHVKVSKGTWWNSIRSSKRIQEDECATLKNAASGANGLSSLYPFAAVTGDRVGKMLAVPPSIGPRVFRLFYNPEPKLLCAAFDVALTPSNRAHKQEADAEVMRSDIDPDWGFRDAARHYYAAYPDAFRNRITRQGIWMPFTSPGSIPHPEDFGISVHEGDNSVESDEKLGILSFRYTEPMTWWMNMAPAIPRTYDEAMKVLAKNLGSTDSQTSRQAQAVLSSGTKGEDGLFNVSFQNQPWANGAVWILNPNPALSRPPRQALQADIVFAWPASKTRYAKSALSGEYLDSLEAHAEVLDYRKESLAASSLCPSFDTRSKRPVIPQAYSTYEIARAMSEHLHGMGKLLFANTTPVNFPGFMPLMDCAGIEVNWLDGGVWSPDGDDVFCYRRTLSYHKPYMLLQNTDFSKFGLKEVNHYFKKCLFYGVFPSFFSADAATHPYWEDPKLFDRDRPVFKANMPLFRMLASYGWEPVTNARTNDPEILIERYGDRVWTIFNEGKATKTATISFENLPKQGLFRDVATGREFRTGISATKPKLTITLEPGDCRILKY